MAGTSKPTPQTRRADLWTSCVIAPSIMRLSFKADYFARLKEKQCLSRSVNVRDVMNRGNLQRRLTSGLGSLQPRFHTLSIRVLQRSFGTKSLFYLYSSLTLGDRRVIDSGGSSFPKSKQTSSLCCCSPLLYHTLVNFCYQHESVILKGSKFRTEFYPTDRWND